MGPKNAMTLQLGKMKHLLMKMTLFLGNIFFVIWKIWHPNFSKIELHDLYSLDLPSQSQLLPLYELRSKHSHIPSLDNFGMNENDIQSTSSKYFDISDSSKSNFSFNKQFSLFHVNTGSLSKNFDQLSAVLSALGTSFDVLGITETK